MISCNRDYSIARQISFYHWSHEFEMDSIETSVLQHIENVSSKKLYVKCFDLVNKNGKIERLSSLQWKQRPPAGLKFVPVVYIENEVFQMKHDSLAENMKSAIELVMGSQFYDALQFDCDWTEQTAKAYFSFLLEMKKIFKGKISVTIRLHQIKFPERTGVPPVESGVLMYYNMGKIAADNSNSILDNSIGELYLDKLNEYPLPLDIALPSYSWLVHSRDNLPVALITKWERDPRKEKRYFDEVSKGHFVSLKSGFLSGRYFKKGDKLKLEKCSEEALADAAGILQKRFKKCFNEVIFFELDSRHISSYDSAFLKSFASTE